MLLNNSGKHIELDVMLCAKKNLIVDLLELHVSELHWKFIKSRRFVQSYDEVYQKLKQGWTPLPWSCPVHL